MVGELNFIPKSCKIQPARQLLQKRVIFGLLYINNGLKRILQSAFQALHKPLCDLNLLRTKSDKDSNNRHGHP